MTKCYSHGKLLLTGEYMVLVGAEALAIPTKMGQSLEFEPNDSKTLNWESWDFKNKLWFNATLDILDFSISNSSDEDIATRLAQILKAVRDQKNNFLRKNGGTVKTHLEFERQWGLGTSSTLISNLARWSQTNPYKLLQNSFGGSGYDIACATAKSPLIFRKQHLDPHIERCEFEPPFKTSLYFVYLNQKKNSREAIQAFKRQNISEEQVAYASRLTRAVMKANTLTEFERLINEHESFISNILGVVPVKEKLFPDFQGAIKSLGAWGGDFILATGDKDTPGYFKNKGFKVVMAYKEMLL
ncbi:MAG: GYDIA family GHMP kinase [Flavobacteriaceae bacterium]|jgi:mevalonate kinase